MKYVHPEYKDIFVCTSLKYKFSLIKIVDNILVFLKIKKIFRYLLIAIRKLTLLLFI